MGVPALGVPVDGPSDDCLSEEAVVGILPVIELLRRRLLFASALLSRCDLADGLLRCGWLSRAFCAFRGDDVRALTAAMRAMAAFAMLGAPPDWAELIAIAPVGALLVATLPASGCNKDGNVGSGGICSLFTRSRNLTSNLLTFRSS